MTVLQAIIDWAADRPSWQQDAIRRLFSGAELSSTDFDDLYALLKIQHGIPDPENRAAQALTSDQVAAPQGADTLVQIKAVKNLRHVNALAESQRLAIAPTGLTVIYGDNGAGKSGYSRVLKKACRARDQREVIRGNARLADDPKKIAEATFEISIDGKDTELKWVNDQPSPEALSAIAIFDGHCARAYIDNHGDYAFVPYGMDILEGLAKACDKLRAMLTAESAKLEVKPDLFGSLALSQTETGKVLRAIAQTKKGKIEELATLSDVDIARCDVLDKSLKEADPQGKAKELRIRSARIEKLADRCAQRLNLVSDSEAFKLRDLIVAMKAAQVTASTAAKAFKETPGQLQGTGSEAWQALLQAARLFAIESHPGREYPHLGPESACPLCQQPLGAASARLVAFDEFIQQEAEKNARTRRNEAEAAYKSFANADHSIGLSPEDKTELAGLDQVLANECVAFQTNIDARHAAIKAACKPDGNWDLISLPPTEVASKLQALATRLSADAETLEKTIDVQARAALEAEFKELDARKQLSAMKISVLDAIAKFDLKAKLKTCEASVRTKPISDKSANLSENVVTKELADALNAELKALNVSELQAALKPVTEKAKTAYKLILELPGSAPAKDILSEGEQRAIAIASFLAEVNKGGGKGGIVFDDPVSSLDHRRRGYVAKRIVQEAAKRQVIVFTHDLHFMCLLENEARHAKTSLHTMSLRKTSAGFGVAADGVPFAGAKIKDRLKALRSLQLECAALYKSGDAAARRREDPLCLRATSYRLGRRGGRGSTQWRHLAIRRRNLDHVVA